MSNNNKLFNNKNQLNNTKCNKKYRSIFTLKYSQPYNLTYNWPDNFVNNNIQFEPDTSLINLKLFDKPNNYHPF